MSQNTNPGETLSRTTGRHAIVGRLVALDELAGEVVVRTGQNKKVTCTHVSPALMEALATKMLQTVCLVGFGTWGGNGGLSDFRPVQGLEFSDSIVDPAADLPGVPA